MVLTKDECWFGFAYAAVIKMPDAALERQVVLIVDDADAEWPSDKEGRVKFRWTAGAASAGAAGSEVARLIAGPEGALALL